MGFKKPKSGDNIGPDTSNFHSGNGPTGKYNDNPYLNKPYPKTPTPEERYESYRDSNAATVVDLTKERNKFFELGRGGIPGTPSQVTSDPNIVNSFRIKPLKGDVYKESEEDCCK